MVKGAGDGRKIGFPTLNLKPVRIYKKEGIYASLVKIDDVVYKSVLFYGPRLVKGEKSNVLEIHVLDFDRQMYGREIEFKIVKYIRNVRNFKSFDEMTREIKKDVAKSLAILKRS